MGSALSQAQELHHEQGVTAAGLVVLEVCVEIGAEAILSLQSKF